MRRTQNAQIHYEKSQIYLFIYYFVAIKILLRIRIRIKIIGFQYQTYISYIEDIHQILFGSANSFESYCVHSKSPRTYRQMDRQIICFPTIVLCKLFRCVSISY